MPARCRHAPALAGDAEIIQILDRCMSYTSAHRRGACRGNRRVCKLPDAACSGHPGTDLGNKTNVHGPRMPLCPHGQCTTCVDVLTDDTRGELAILFGRQVDLSALSHREAHQQWKKLMFTCRSWGVPRAFPACRGVPSFSKKESL